MNCVWIPLVKSQWKGKLLFIALELLFLAAKVLNYFQQETPRISDTFPLIIAVLIPHSSNLW